MDFNASADSLMYSGQFGNESQMTLVDTSAFGAPNDVVSFLRDSMRNTTILSSDERLLYSVNSDPHTNAWTRICKGESKEVIAEVKRKDLRPDRIKFGGNPSVKLSSFMKGQNNKWSDFPVSFEWNSSTYTWKTNSSRQIALYHEDDPVAPVAWFQTSRKQVIDGVPTFVRALLALQSEAHAILDGIIISLLVVEQGLRVTDDRYKKMRGVGVTLPA